MADSTEIQRASYPLPVYSFRVTVDGVSMSFSEVSGIKVEYGSVTYRHGLSYAEGEQVTRFHIDSYTPVTLKRGTPSRHSARFQVRESQGAPASANSQGRYPVGVTKASNAFSSKRPSPSSL